LVFRISRWPAAKLAEFFGVAWQIDFYCQEVIFVPKGVFLAFVVSSHYISLHTVHTDIQTDIRRYQNADSFIMRNKIKIKTNTL
jgi:hypothetical protein